MTPRDNANIDNLTSLWRRLGSEQHDLGAGLSLEVSRAWPHRRWLAPGARPDAAQLDALLVALGEDADAVVPVWPGSDGLGAALSGAGLPADFELTAMVRPGALPVHGENDSLTLVDVVDEGLADTWTAVASESFGYVVDGPVVRGALDVPELGLFLATRGDDPVGTVLLFEDAGVVGVHMMGVLPDHRRQGLARRIMHAALRRSAEWGPVDVTLQASAAARSLYLSLGFEVQFPISHHRSVPVRVDTDRPIVMGHSGAASSDGRRSTMRG